MKFLLLFFGLMMTNYANGQDVQSPQPSDLAPGTMRVLCNVLSADKQFAKIVVVEVIATGRGLTNPVAQGDTVMIHAQAKPLKNARHKIVIDIKEKLSVDASKTEYVLIDWKKNVNH